jgi:two-component system, OmpR family, phosphate regulon sensor histidine kinase PhoR
MGSGRHFGGRQDGDIATPSEAIVRTMPRVLPDPGSPAPTLRLAPDHLALLSYQLRGPLTAILGCVDLLAERLPGGDQPAGGAALVEAIRRSAVRQARLLDNMSALSDLRIAGRPRVADWVSDVVAIPDLARRLPCDLAVELAETGVLLAVLPAGEAPVVLGDPDRLRHALRELVRNAVAASSRGQTVMVSVGTGTTPTGERELVVRVEDCGEGIAAEDLPRLTEPFARTARSRERHQPGVGLGLTVAAGVIEAHHGRLELSSVAGQGTRVVVRLPAAGQ